MTTIIRYQFGETEEIKIPEGYVICSQCKGKGGQSKYDQGWHSVMYSPELDVVYPCYLCRTRGFVKNEHI